MENRLASALRSNVAFPCSNQRFFRRALHLNSDSSILSVARFVRWVVTQTVLRPDLGCHQSKRCARILQTRCQEIASAAGLRDLIHLTARQIVYVAADLHLFKLAHLAEIAEVVRPCPWEVDPSIALKLFRGKRQPPIILTIFQQTILDEVFRVDLDEVTGHPGTTELRPRGLEISITG